MSKISLEPNDSGAGTFSIVSPDSNTNRTLNLPDESGILFSDGSGVPGSAVTGQLASSNMPAGSVIQVVQNSFDTQTEITSTSYVSTGLSASITPISSSNKILIFVDLLGDLRFDAEDRSQYGDLDLRRNGTSITERSVRKRSSGTVTNVAPMNFGTIDFDAPNTTSLVTYETFCRTRFTTNNGSFFFNHAAGESTITLMEIAG